MIIHVLIRKIPLGFLYTECVAVRNDCKITERYSVYVILPLCPFRWIGGVTCMLLKTLEKRFTELKFWLYSIVNNPLAVTASLCCYNYGLTIKHRLLQITNSWKAFIGPKKKKKKSPWLNTNQVVGINLPQSLTYLLKKEI